MIVAPPAPPPPSNVVLPLEAISPSMLVSLMASDPSIVHFSVLPKLAMS
ncbi:MAG: hypothetical protein AB7O24_19160 [Kofleriaceae bacterium]